MRVAKLLLIASLPLLPSSALGAQQEAADPWESFAERAATRHGDLGARCAAFLRDNRPPGDETLTAKLLEENLFLALAARRASPGRRTSPRRCS